MRQPRPTIRLVRLTRGQIDLYLENAAADLPAPWQASDDAGVWVLAAEAASELQAPEAANRCGAMAATAHRGHRRRGRRTSDQPGPCRGASASLEPRNRLVRRSPRCCSSWPPRVAADVDITPVGICAELGEALGRICPPARTTSRPSSASRVTSYLTKHRPPAFVATLLPKVENS